MSTTQAPQDTEPPAQREGWWRRQTTTARILVIALPVLVLVLIVAVFTRPSPAPTTPDTGITSQRANACLGGATDLNTAVQYAQANAPLTGTGAAEFLATVIRWSGSEPSPSATEKAAMLPRLVTAEALPSFSAPTPAPAGTAASLTAEGGFYRVLAATPSSATVEVSLKTTTTDPGASTSRTGDVWGIYTVAAVDGVWRVAGQPSPTGLSQIQQNGNPFQGPCR